MSLKQLVSKYSHLWVLLYFFVYMAWFTWLEKTTTEFYEIHLPIDDKIPFCEYFIIPYYLWFLFVPAVIVYLMLYSKQEFYQATAFLFIGMTIFLIICTVWPNGIKLRATDDLTDKTNICAELVKGLRKTDTSTNVFPSIHVFNTLGCLIALYKSKGLAGKKNLKIAATILSLFIILSTMFLKQHSVVDVIGGFGLAAVMYFIVYVPRWEKVRNHE